MLDALNINSNQKNKSIELASDYFKHCQSGFPALSAVVLRGQRNDIVPGISDIDIRFICNNVKPDQWPLLADLVYKTHSALTAWEPIRHQPLEHPPGACITTDELLNPRLFYQEMWCWDWCTGIEAIHKQIDSYLAAKEWTEIDERRCMICFLSTLVDDAGSKSALPRHSGTASVVLHFFLPALQYGLSIIEGHMIPSRMQALDMWLSNIPNSRLLAEVKDRISQCFNLPSEDDQRIAVSLAHDCCSFLDTITPLVISRAQFHQLPAGTCREDILQKIDPIVEEPLMVIHNAVRFSRIRSAHYRYFLSLPQDIESNYLIHNEINTLKNILTYPAFAAYAKIQGGVLPQEPEDVVITLDKVLSGAYERAVVWEVCEIAKRHSNPAASRKIIQRISEIYPTYHIVLEKMLADVIG